MSWRQVIQICFIVSYYKIIGLTCIDRHPVGFIFWIFHAKCYRDVTISIWFCIIGIEDIVFTRYGVSINSTIAGDRPKFFYTFWLIGEGEYFSFISI